MQCSNITFTGYLTSNIQNGGDYYGKEEEDNITFNFIIFVSSRRVSTLKLVSKYSDGCTVSIAYCRRLDRAGDSVKIDVFLNNSYVYVSAHGRHGRRRAHTYMSENFQYISFFSIESPDAKDLLTLYCREEAWSTFWIIEVVHNVLYCVGKTKIRIC